MKPFTKTIHSIGAAWLLAASLALPASAVEAEVELRCEFRPTRAAVAAADARRVRKANAAILKEEIADEVATRRHSERTEFSLRPAALPFAPTSH